MVQRIFIIAMLLLAVLAGDCQQKPNIIFILADDLGWSDLPVYGNRFNETPNLDAMAKQGALYTNAYAAAPVCSPTRASIMSGQYPVRTGFLDFIPGHWRPYESVIVPQNRTQYLPAEVVTIGEAMKQAGYRTGYFGRWNLGDSSIYQPSQQGFDETNAGRSRPGGKRLRSSEIIADLGESFIEKNKDQPFFLFMGSYDVHTPLNADSALIAKYMLKPRIQNYPSNAVYAAAIEQMDQMIGRILNKVTKSGLDHNTIVVFFSDNGGLNYSFTFGKSPVLAPDKQYLYAGDSLLYLVTSNNPLRGVKGNLYEGGIRVPMIVKYPEKWKSATVVNDIVSSVDFFPSFVSLAGGKMPSEQAFDGVDIFRGKVSNDRPLFWHYPVYHHGVPASAIRLGDWKLIRNLADSTYELYNLKNDIGETSNLIAAQPAQLAALSALLDNWLKEMKAPMPVPNPEFDEKRRSQWGKHPAKSAFK